MKPQTQHSVIDRQADDKKSAESRTRLRSFVTALPSAPPNSIALRDGELVIYRRSRSLLYQCRYKLADGSWVRQTTGKAALEHAIARACDIYDEARYRQRLGLAHRTHSVAQIAAVCCAALRQEIDAKGKKSALNDYASVIERYFVPYFGERTLESLTHTDIREFELWRDRQLSRRPKTSTLNNFTTAWNRLIATAVERGWVSERVPVPKLTAKGVKGSARPAFSSEEIAVLLPFMEQWSKGGRLAVEREIRPLLRDYVEMLLYTGMRHGTEAMGIRWQHIEWHTKDGVRYLRIWVDGKTGGRWLIAKHAAVDVLRRLHSRQRDIAALSFETTLTQRVPHLLFRFSDGHQPHSLVGTFRKLMRDSGLLRDSEGKARTLYSLRHTYATQAMLEGQVDIHTLSRQMGNSAAMIERHYSKLTATLAAERLA
jgi:integrase